MSTGHHDHASSPSLTASAAAREATPESVVFGSEHGHKASSKPSLLRDATSPTVPKADLAKDVKGDDGDDLGVSDVQADLGSKATPKLGSRVASPVINSDGDQHSDNQPETEIRAGLSKKPFFVSTRLLVSKSPWFAAIASSKFEKPEVVTTSNYGVTTGDVSGPFTFKKLDEYAMSLFVHWLYGKHLTGPCDFNTMNHYLCLYVLAAEFQIEELKNNVMDLIRDYYHTEKMTAPAFRLDYVYSNLAEPCLMRTFLVSTAAYRALDEPNGISDSMKGVLKQGGDISVDYATALLNLAKNDRVDVRKGDPCAWHEHTITQKCPGWGGFQPFEEA